MADTNTLQKLLFQKIKEQLRPHQSLVDEVSDILNITPDGVYRRIRGETPLRLNEAATLCNQFQISLDELHQQSNGDAIVFHPSGLNEANLDFESYLRNLLGLLSYIQSRGVTRSLYAAKDIPVFHLFQFPELALFKMFFWQKTIFNSPKLAGAQFEPRIQSEKEERCVQLCHQIAEKYALIPTTEIWNEETSVSFLKQIAYYHEAGLFKSREDALFLTELVEKYFNHLNKEADLGYKFLASNPPQNRVQNYTLYYNDLILIDNIINLTYENGSQTFLIYHSIEYLSTSHQGFCEQVSDWLVTLTKTSDLISTVSQKQRYRFFRTIQEKVDKLKDQLR